ncbi:MAG TPA: aldehyde dehydrogenase family protein, partial [Sphingomonadaceae bacterium]|nr:aldehyde dehydrogenase family protein [Sphingomonadaceae bacterium]
AEVSGAAGRLNDRQKQWAARPLQERRERLLAWHAILDAARDDWTTMLVRDVGKPLRDVQGEIGYALALLAHCCRSLEDFEQGEGRSIRYRPLGIVGIITPWNNPLAMPVSKLAPALAYGNCVVWKPALEGTAMARALKQSLEEAGLGDLVELVTGGADAGRALVEAPGLAAIAFTGSVKVGREIATRCGRLMRPVQAELGGNNAAIVLVDADLSLAAEELAAAMFSFAGQRCTAIRRVIVERSAYAEFAELLRKATQALKTGDPADPETQVGPLISKARQQELLALVERAASEGAEILTGGSVPTDCSADGCWMLPTIVARLPEDSPILGTELFGPVVALVEADDLDAALAEHNRGEMGLLGALFSNDKEAQARFLAEAEAGMLLLNQARPAFSPAGPFVGWKNSGYGIPEHGRWNRDFYTRTQAVYGE